jgi:hypothetical protein
MTATLCLSQDILNFLCTPANLLLPMSHSSQAFMHF